MSNLFPNLNDLLNVVLNTSAASEASNAQGAQAQAQQQQQQTNQSNKIKLPSIPPNIVPLTEKDLQSLLYQTQPDTKTDKTLGLESSSNSSLTSMTLNSSSTMPLLAQLPLPNIDNSTKDLQHQMNQFSSNNQQQQLSQMQQLQKLQQLHQLDQLQKMQFMNQQNSMINDFQTMSIMNQNQQSLINNSNQNQGQINYGKNRNDNNNNNRNSHHNYNRPNTNLGSNTNYKSNFLKGTNIDIDDNEVNDHSSSFNENINNNIDIYQYVSDKHYMPGTASLIEDIDKQLMVILRDGKTLIGYLRSIDQYANLLLSNTIERVYVGNKYGEIPRGVYIVRGENVVLIGEVDFTLPNKIEMIKVDYNEIVVSSTPSIIENE